MRKLMLCNGTFDYTDEHKDVDQKAARLRALKFMHSLMQDPANVKQYIQPNLPGVMQMIEKQIFRPLPHIQKLGDVEVEKEELIDPSWPHIEGVYKLLFQVVSSPEIEA